MTTPRPMPEPPQWLESAGLGDWDACERALQESDTWHRVATTPTPATAEARAAVLSLADDLATLRASLSLAIAAVEEFAATTWPALQSLAAGGRRGLDAQRSPYGPRP